MGTRNVMLARLSEHAYWMSRYLERGESLARMLSTTHLMSLDYKYYLSMSQNPLMFFLVEDRNFYNLTSEGPIDNEKTQSFLVWHKDNPTSLSVTFWLVRKNAKMMREALTDDMWQTINALYLWMITPEAKEEYAYDRLQFYKKFLDCSVTVKGELYNSYFRNGYYYLMDMSFMIERANQMIYIVDSLTRDWHNYTAKDATDSDETVKFYQLLLECCGAKELDDQGIKGFEPESFIRFFLKEKRFPFSIPFCLERILKDFQFITIQEGSWHIEKAFQILQELQESLSAVDLALHSTSKLHKVIGDIRVELSKFNETLQQKWDMIKK